MHGTRFALALGLVAAPLAAQTIGKNEPARRTMREDALDPSPVDPSRDPNISRFLNDWRTSAPRTAFGRLVYRDILTRLDSDDPIRPVKRGAVLTAISAVSYATLAPGASATGRSKAGERQIFYTVAGMGQLSVNANAHSIKEGVGFTLTPSFNFMLANTGKQPLAFYVRTEPLPAGEKVGADVIVIDRRNFDRRIGAHWTHICNGGPAGMSLCTIAPYTMPQPHSHSGEEAWLLVKGESVLSLGKNLVRMHPGQAYKIPPTGFSAHSNLNLGDEPIQLLYMGPAVRGPASAPSIDFARLDNTPIVPAIAPDIDMFTGRWQDAYPRISHGNLYLRDMLTALQGADSLHPTRKGAVLVNAAAVSYAMLEPGSTAHRSDTDPKDLQETFVVASGTGAIAVNGKKTVLSKNVAFIVTPDLNFLLTATGESYLTFYVVAEKITGSPAKPFEVVDRQTRPSVKDWFYSERPLVTKADGLGGFSAISHVELRSMAMARPTSAAADAEEIWIALDDVDVLIGKQLRHVLAGTALKVPATGITAHANINLANKPAEFLTIVK